MTDKLSEVLNIIIPWIIMVIGLYLLYRPLKEPLSGLFGWIRGIIGLARGEKETSDYQPIRYE